MESYGYCEEAECEPDFDHDAIFDPYRWVRCIVDDFLLLSSDLVKVLNL